jgi:hypothetical protein
MKKKLVALLTTSASVIGMSVMMAPAAHASGYSLVKTWHVVAGGCSLYDDLLLGPDGHNYQQAHVQSTNGDYCAVAISQMVSGTNNLTYNWAQGTTSSTSLWTPVVFDGPSYVVDSATTDNTHQASAQTPWY